MPVSSVKINSKLPEAGTTIFTVMSALAREFDAINLSQGFPDFDVHPELTGLVAHYMHKGCNQYAPMQGLLSLREALCEKAGFLYGAKPDPQTEINITSGATQAIFTAIMAVVRPGDEVIILEPAYDCYAPAVELAGGTCVFVKLESPGFTVNWDTVRNAISPKTRMLIINSPHNPMGSVLSTEDMAELDLIVRESPVIILSDEVYEHVIFDGLQHESVLRYPTLFERSFVIFSFGKTYHATGWKLGYCFAPEYLMNEFRKVHQFLVFTSNTPMQHALSDFVRNKNYLELPAFYEQKRNFFLNLIKGTEFQFKPAKGSYFQLLDYSRLSNEADTEYSVRLTKESGIASIPTSVFYHKAPPQHLLRFCFAKKESTLEAAAEKLIKINAYGAS